jgi:hypothetical protein
MLDMNDEAIALYQFGKNDEKLAPATHGNLVRARLVKMYLTAGEAKSVANRSSEQ